MKKIIAFMSAVVLSLLCVCVPVQAKTFMDTAKELTSGKTVKTTINEDETKYYKINASEKGDIKFKVTMDAATRTNAVYVFLYDSDGGQIESWMGGGNSAGITIIEKTYHVKKGTYYLGVKKVWSSGSGETKITATFPSSKKESSASLPAISLKKGGTVALGAIVSGKGTTDVSLSTSDKKVAKVDSDGVVTGVGKGTAVITIKNGKKTYQIGIIVE